MAAATKTTDAVADFVALSAVLTGFRKIDLLGTGMARQYHDALISIVGEATSAAFVGAAMALLQPAGKDADAAEKALATLLSDNKLGPLARNVIKMWYLGNWSQLPQEWRDAYGANARDTDHVVSADAYQEGLVWRAIGSHPAGAKQPGFGTWSLPPEFEAS